MPRPRFDRLPPQRREEILEAAARHFASAGYADASYNQILEDAGLSKSSAYYLFENKADLYAAVMEREIAAMIGASDALPLPNDIDSYWLSVRMWLRSLLNFLAAHPRAAALFGHYADAWRRGSVPNLDPAIDAALIHPLAALLAAGQPLGAVRTDLDLALLSAVMSGSLAALDRHFLPLLGGEDVDDEPALDLYIDTMQRLLSPR